MGQYTVNLQGGGQIVVNASDPQAALENAGNPAGASVSAGSYTGGGGGGGGVGGGGTAATTVAAGGGQQLASGINSLLGAIASGNKQAFDEAVRQFNQTFGLDQSKFQEAVRQFNENLGLQQAGLTGTYNGQQTQQAQQQQFAQQAALAQMYGQGYGNFGAVPQGQETLAAQQQRYAQQMGMIQQAAALQANPFRQQQAIGQMSRLLGGQGVAGFSAPNTVPGVGLVGQGQPGMNYAMGGAFPGEGTVNGNDPSVRNARIAQLQGGGGSSGGTGMNYLQQMIDDIRDPTANTQSMNQVLQGIPTPNKLNSVEFLRAAPSTQNMVLQGMQEKYGLDPSDALAQIKNTLPGFQAPSSFGSVKR